MGRLLAVVHQRRLERLLLRHRLHPDVHRCKFGENLPRQLQHSR